MFEEVKYHLEEAMAEYANGQSYDTLLKAKSEYFILTGSVDEESDEYEQRMNCFNDWFLFQYIPNRDEHISIMQKYLEKHNINGNISECLNSIRYSLFEFKKINFKKNIVLQDMLGRESVIIPQENSDIGLVEKDIFIGRYATFDNKNYLLKGVCTLPHEIRSALYKKSKKIHKMKNMSEEKGFLIQLEYLKSKWNRYGHIEASKFFDF